MPSPVMTITQKELRIRFGSKSAIIPMFITLGMPLYVFVPTLIQTFQDSSPEAKYVGFLFFLIIPTMGTTLVGINAFINEIRWNTMQTLLVAPISKREIFLGKSFASIFLGLTINILLAIIFIATIPHIQTSKLLLFFLVGPLAVVFTTFVFILGIGRYPTLSESGGSILFPILSLTILAGLFLLITAVFGVSEYLAYLLLSAILVLLVVLNYYLSLNVFKQEIFLSPL